MNKTRNFYILLIVISVVGLGIRLWVCHDLFSADKLSHTPPAYTDMATYHQLSQTIFNGNFNQTFYFQPFYYAVFLPLIYIIAGTGVWHILVAQAILGGLTIWLTGMSAAAIKGRKAGITAGLLIAFSLMAVFYSAYLLIATLKTFLIALMVLQ